MMEAGVTPVSDKVECIVHGMEQYFRAFALADNMSLHRGDIEWIHPKPGKAGPSIVFNVALTERNIHVRLTETLSGIQVGLIPSFWVITPTATPPMIVDALLSCGFTGGVDSEHPEPGMALDLVDFSTESRTNANFEIKKVASSVEFSDWIDVVNEALHGWNMLTSDHYSAWLHHPPYKFYLGCQDGTPVSTLATLQDGEMASVEFVSTQEGYRRQGAATALLIAAMNELEKKGVRTVTLRSNTDAIPFYIRHGFKPYYNQALFSYPKG